MKKRFGFYLALTGIIFLSVFTCRNTYADIVETTSQLEYRLPINQKDILDNNGQETCSFSLPSSLTIIEDSAFEGTAISTVELPTNVTVVGDYAFANIPTLREISIPNATAFIGENAFKGSANVTITGAPKSYARAWAREMGIPFNPVESFYAASYTIQITGLSEQKTKEQKLLINGETSAEKPDYPTGRMAGELKADQYNTITAYHIQGRSPPIA